MAFVILYLNSVVVFLFLVNQSGTYRRFCVGMHYYSDRSLADHFLDGVLHYFSSS